MNFPEDDGTDEGGIVRCECGRAVPYRHCPTPIDPADIRPGDVVEFRRRVNVTRVDPDGWIFENGLGFATGSVPRTWHLVSRPDPDAEAVEALAEFLHDQMSDCRDPYGTTCVSTSEFYRDKAKRIVEFQRRAES